MLQVSWLRRRVVWNIATNVSKKAITPIFKVEGRSRKDAIFYCNLGFHVHCGALGRVFSLENQEF